MRLCDGSLQPGLVFNMYHSNFCLECGHEVAYRDGMDGRRGTKRGGGRRTLRWHYPDGSYTKGRGAGRFPKAWQVPA